MIIALLRKIASGLMMLFLVIGSLCGAVAGKMMVEGHRGKDAQIGLLVGLGFWGLAALMAWLSVLQKKKENFRGCRVPDSQWSGAEKKSDSPAVVSGSNERSNVPKEEDSVSMNDDVFYDQVAEEIETGNLVRGVWTRAFAEADGDENRAKAIYIKLRISQLSEEMSRLEKQKQEKINSEEAELRRRIRDEVDWSKKTVLLKELEEVRARSGSWTGLVR